MILCRGSEDLGSSQMDPFPLALFDSKTNFLMQWDFQGLYIHGGRKGTRVHTSPKTTIASSTTPHEPTTPHHSVARHSSHLRMEDVPLPLTFFQPKQQ